MKVYKYKDYNHYKESQTRTNKEKITWSYVKKTIINKISQDKKIAEKILCHGTRNGTEQKFFKDNFPDAYVIGTEISDTALNFPMTVMHDFSIEKPEWIGVFDIIYSNSFDHSYDPEKTIVTWKNQLNDTGRLYLEYAETQSIGNDADPLDATEKEVEGLIEKYMIIYGKIKEDVKHNGIVFICGVKP